VTETRATSPDDPAFPPGRYGRRRRPGRRRPVLVGLLAVLVVVAMTAIAVRLYRQYGQPEFAPRLLAVPETADDRVTVRFEVRKRGDDPAVCRVRARARNGEEVGAADVAVPAGRRVVVTSTVSTRARAFAADVPRCRRAAG
jgi:predicted secreted protein